MPWWVILFAALLVAVGTWAATAWLLAHVQLPANADVVERAKLRVETIRTGLSVGAGIGAGLALLLAGRRQWLAERAHLLAERAQEATEHDAAERRVTELYVKAADQLGSDKAAVRLAGLYALERLAQNTPGQRQTIVNVICAYLRMPFTPPGDRQPPPARGATRRYGTMPGHPRRPAPTPMAAVDLREELQVRLTAQRILSDHLTIPEGINPASIEAAGLAADPALPFWPGIHLDLTAATLVDFTLNRARAAEAVFIDATFTGLALFEDATFTGGARFSGAIFTGGAWFNGATFTGGAWFSRATFTGDARFGGATFTDLADFDGATFTSDAWFNVATFTSDAWFSGATFTRDAWFGGATFTRNAWFNVATLSGDARFAGATFTGDARFAGATFTGDARFDEATFTGDARFAGATFTGDARFDEATFTGDARFAGATFQGRVDFQRANGKPSQRHLWPPGWHMVTDPTDPGQGRLEPDSRPSAGS
jgi:hypothetical protein